MLLYHKAARGQGRWDLSGRSADTAHSRVRGRISQRAHWISHESYCLSCTCFLSFLADDVSMSLPSPTLSRWREITRHTLLERYGMSELGMVLSQPLDGDRVEGTVGAPLPSVEVMIAQECDGKAAGAPGEAADVEVHRRDACPGIAMRRSHAISA